MLTLDKVYHAHYVLKDAIRETDIIYSPVLSSQCGAKVYLKTDLVNYYEKFGFNYLEDLNNGEKLYYMEVLWKE